MNATSAPALAPLSSTTRSSVSDDLTLKPLLKLVITFPSVATVPLDDTAIPSFSNHTPLMSDLLERPTLSKVIELTVTSLVASNLIALKIEIPTIGTDLIWFE